MAYGFHCLTMTDRWGVLYEEEKNKRKRAVRERNEARAARDEARAAVRHILRSVGDVELKAQIEAEFAWAKEVTE